MNSQRIRQLSLKLRSLGVLLYLTWVLLLLLDIPAVGQLVYLMPYAQGLLALLVLAADPIRRSRPRWILAGGVLWLIGLTLLHGAAQLSLARYALGNAAFAFLVCESAGEADAKAQLRLLRCAGIVLVGIVGVYSLFGAVAALTGSRIYTFDASHYAGLRKGRLNLFRYPTVAGNLAMLAILADLWLLCCTEKRWTRVALLILLVLFVFCLGLTDTRTAFIALGAVLGILAGMGLWRRVPHRPLGLAAAAGAAVAVLVAVYGLLSLVPMLYSALGIPSGGKVYLNDYLPLHVTAGAETIVQTTQATHRAIDSGVLLSGRPAVWRAAFRLLAQKPLTLLTGLSTVDPMGEILPLVEGSKLQYEHVHNMLLQILVETGLPGLALACAYLVYLLRAMARLLLRGSLRDRLLTALPLGILLMDLAETHLRLALQNPSPVLLLLFAGAVLARSEALKKELA